MDLCNPPPPHLFNNLDLSTFPHNLSLPTLSCFLPPSSHSTPQQPTIVLFLRTEQQHLFLLLVVPLLQPPMTLSLLSTCTFVLSTFESSANNGHSISFSSVLLLSLTFPSPPHHHQVVDVEQGLPSLMHVHVSRPAFAKQAYHSHARI